MESEPKLGSLPGAEIVNAGIADLEAGRDTVEANAVLMAAARLRAVGQNVPAAARSQPAAHRLYEQLARDDARGVTRTTTRSCVGLSASHGPRSVRAPTDEERIRRLAEELGRRAPTGTRV